MRILPRALSCLRGAALRLSGKHWDRGLTAEERRAVAERDLAEEEEVRDALAASAVAPAAVVVVQAYPLG